MTHDVLAYDVGAALAGASPADVAVLVEFLERAHAQVVHHRGGHARVPLVDALVDALRSGARRAAALDRLHAIAGTSESGSAARHSRPHGSRFISTSEAAVVLGCSSRWARELARRGELPGARRLGTGTWLIPVEAVTHA
jgi:excisionase family DNA binding protein